MPTRTDRRRLGRFTLGRELGRGGQGRVYEAFLAGPGGSTRRVALKVVADGAGLRREARLGGLLRHPHLVDVYEVGEEDGTWFLAMEFCGDGTLADRGPLPPAAVIDVGLQVCDALAYAHAELGLVHLDLKPQNLLLDGAVVKVADLGIAELLCDGVVRRVRGTEPYMAPEQRRGGRVDARSDVHALGVVLGELATGGVVERRSEATVTFDDATPEPEAPADVPWLQPVLSRCLAPDPRDRFGSMDELAAALRELPRAGAGLAEALGARAPTGALVPVAVEPADVVFVGRELELQQLLPWLDDEGPIVLRGPAGIGKTRLAAELARRFADRRDATVVVCDLADARSAPEVDAAVARALDLELTGVDDAARIGHALAARGRCVLVLDQCEHLRPHAATVGTWAARADDARLVLTSREPVHVAGERLFEVDVMVEADAVALVRAAAARRGVEVADEPAVRELVRRLDGLPLALELAAGRLGVLGAADVVERLSLSMLRSGRVGASDRAATLRGALAWSWDLLEPTGREALVQLSVFRGGFGLDAAEAVLRLPAGGADTAALLEGLVDRSWLKAGGDRWTTLETVRQFAAERQGDREGAADRHGAWFATFGTDAALATLARHGGEARFRALKADLENVVAACRHAVELGRVEAAVHTLRAASSVLDATGPTSIAPGLAQAVLAVVPSSSALRPDAELSAGYAAVRVGRLDHGRERLEAALRGAEERGRTGLRGRVERALGRLEAASGRQTEALDRGRRALDLARAARDRIGEAHALLDLGNASRQLGRTVEAAAWLDQCLAIHRELGGTVGEAQTLACLGQLEVERGDTE